MWTVFEGFALDDIELFLYPRFNNKHCVCQSASFGYIVFFFFIFSCFTLKVPKKLIYTLYLNVESNLFFDLILQKNSWGSGWWQQPLQAQFKPLKPSSGWNVSTFKSGTTTFSSSYLWTSTYLIQIQSSGISVTGCLVI